MLQPSPPSQTCGCLFGLLGTLSGILLGTWDFGRYVEAAKAADPDGFVCGTPIIAALFGGAIFGGFAGTLVGAAVGSAIENKNRERHQRGD